MNVFVVTCGISIIEGMRQAALAGWAGAPMATRDQAGSDELATIRKLLVKGASPGWSPDHGRLASAYLAIDKWTDAPAGEWTTVLDGWRGVAEVHGLFGQGADLRLRSQGTAISAELSSLAAGRDGGDRPPPYGPSDRLVFFASDSVRGVVAAHLNAAYHARELRFYVDPTAWKLDDALASVGDPDAPAESAEIVRIPDLVADDARKFARAARFLGIAFDHANRLAANGRLILHATGGYKATIATLTGIMEHLYPRGAKHEAWCLFEGTHDRPLRLPMRRTASPDESERWMTSLKRALTKAGDEFNPTDPQSQEWEGKIYVLSDGVPGLTPLGEALASAWSEWEVRRNQ